MIDDMRGRRRFSIKFIAFSLTPLVALLVAAEAAARVKYFIQHDYKWLDLTTPFPLNARSAPERWMAPQDQAPAGLAPQPPASQIETPPPAVTPPPSAPVPAGPAATTAPAPATIAPPTPAAIAPPAQQTTASPPRESRPPAVSPPVEAPPPAADRTPGEAPASQNEAGLAASASPPPPAPPPAASPAPRGAPAVTAPAQPAPAPVRTPPPQQMVFKWQKPCVDQTVFSTKLNTVMPRTWDDNCFRGDHIAQQKAADEYRVVFLGGSTVEDAQSDSEMMTAQFKQALPRTFRGKQLKVVNAGKAGFESERILLHWNAWVQKFSPDLVLYYEAWNEQPTDFKFTRVDQRISTLRNRVHTTLYYRSMFYTYLVEKFHFLSTPDEHFWKIDVERIHRNLPDLAARVRRSGARYVFVTQVIRFPRLWKGVDTFDYRAVDALLDRLRNDRTYVYDVTEISALNQRLAVLYTLELCRQQHIPVINILEAVEALGEDGRASMFTDLGHLSVTGDRIVGRLIARQVDSVE